MLREFVKSLKNRVYRYCVDHPALTRPLLRILVPVLKTIPPLTRGRVGRILGDFGNLIQCRVYTRTKLIDGTLIIVPRNDVVGNQIVTHGQFEPETVTLFDRLLKSGMTFMDVGAHVGQYTLLASTRVGLSGQVHSFEPDTETFACLKKNVVLNGFNNVQVNRKALGKENGTVEFYLSSLETMGSNSLKKPPHYSGRTIQIEVQRLSDYMEENGIQSLDVVKIDVEGAEYEMIDSSRDVFSRYKPAIIIEFNRSAGSKFGRGLRDLDTLLQELDYRLFRIEANGLRPYVEDVDGPKLFNVLAVPIGNDPRFSQLAEL